MRTRPSIVLSLFIYGCDSSSNTDTTAAESALNQSLTTVNSKVSTAASVIDSSSSSSLNFPTRSGEIGTLTALNLDWITDPGVIPLSNTGSSSLKQWFTNQFDPTFTNSNGAKITFTGRIANQLGILCILGRLGLPTDATNLPTATAHTASIAPTHFTACGEEAPASAMDVTITGTDLTDTTFYDRKFSVDMGNACPFVFQARISSTAINIASAEDQNCDGFNQASSTIIHYDVTNDVLKFTYISQAFGGFPGGFEFYRGYYNGANQETYMLGHYGEDNGMGGAGGLSGGISYTATGKVGNAGTVAISAKLTGQPSVNGTYNGCMSQADLSISSTTDTLTCTLTGEDITTPFTNVIVATHDSNTAIADIYQLPEAANVSFTDKTDIFL